MTQMPLEVKLAYAAIYDEFANNEVQRLNERMTWLAVAEFDGADALDNASMMRLQVLITRARWRAGNITGNAEETKQTAHKMGIEPEPLPPQGDVANPLCTAILPKA
jgi:hypothetical protein